MGVTAGLAVPGTTPLASHTSHSVSKSALARAAWSNLSRSYGLTSSFRNAPSSSASEMPPNSGWMSGWTMDSVPSRARASPQISNGCAAGRNQFTARDVSSSWSPR